jgi:hypothetical protein
MISLERIAYHSHLLLLTLLVSSQSCGATANNRIGFSPSPRQKNVHLMI